MFRRAMTLIVALVLLAGLAIGGYFLPVPYIVASPGLAVNTIGETEGEEPVIQVDGRKTYTHDGGLNMVTVQYTGGPQGRMDMFNLVRAWLSPNESVLPEEAVFPPERSVEEVSEEQSLEMEDSQTAATAAALTELGIDYENDTVIADVDEDAPAAGKLEQGDTVTEVDGDPAGSNDEVAEEVADRAPGDDVEITVEREGDTERFEMSTTESDDGTAVVGVIVANNPDFPFEVDISIGEIGGPSAGMMFALGIMDRLSPEGLTDGNTVAGTGTITTQGKVGGVSGVAQKMVSAQRKGAEYFLVPEESCGQTVDSAASDDLSVVRVSELSEAVSALETIRSGDGELPRCEAD